LALEILQVQPQLVRAAWVVPAGGGGLISGIGAALKNQAALIGAQSEASPFLYDILHTGSQDHSIELPSLADGLSGPVEAGSLTIPLVRQYVADFVLVSEESIARAIGLAWRRYGERIEGSSAAALAAVLSGSIPQRPAVVVISGGNIQPELHSV
jgi:threonine dehydratase